MRQAAGRISFICRHARRHRAYPRIIAYGFKRATRQLPPGIPRAENANLKTQLIETDELLLAADEGFEPSKRLRHFVR
jgi:hypothetical protein